MASALRSVATAARKTLARLGERLFKIAQNLPLYRFPLPLRTARIYTRLLPAAWARGLFS